jgi:hypothetical protein
VHGGKTPVGAALPQFKTGRYSKYIPDRLAARYQEAQDDPQLLELRAEVALIDARLADLLARVDTGEAGAAWRQARDLWVDLADARGGPHEDKLFHELGRALKAGAADFAIWNDVQSTIEQRRRLVESERKRLVEAQQTITVERAMILIGAISHILQKHVTDRTQLASISHDIRALLGPASGGHAGASSDEPAHG